jgi:hypothetical protein
VSYKATNWAYELPLVGPQKFVLVALADMADEANSCYPGQKRLVAMTGFAEKTVRRALASLEDSGLLRREQRHGAFGYRTSDRYTLNVGVQMLETLPVTEPSGLSAHRSESPFLPVSQSQPTGQSDQAVEPSEEPLVEPSGRKPEKKKPSLPLPDVWSPSKANIAYAVENNLDVDHEVEQFRAHAAANDRRQADWSAAFRMWLGNQAKWSKPVKKIPKVSPQDEWRFH